MRELAVNMQRYFQPIFGTAAWRVRLGVGSFLTFEFGSRIKAHGFIHGQWHLWVYLANWKLMHRGRRLVDSEAERKVIQVSIRRLQEMPLTGVEFDPSTRETTFTFPDFRLVISPPDDSEGFDERD